MAKFPGHYLINWWVAEGGTAPTWRYFSSHSVVAHIWRGCSWFRQKTLTHNTIQGQDEFEWSSCCVLSRKPQKSVNFLHVLRHARPTKSFICCVGQRRVRWIRPDCCYWLWMPWTHSCIECSVQREQEVWIHDQELISAMVRNINSLSARSQTYWEQEHRHPIPRSSQHHTWWRKIIARDFIYLE